MSNESEVNLAARLNTKLYRLFVVLIFAAVILGSFRPVMDNVDLGFHIAQGRWMVQHAAIYRQDVLNYPNLGHRVIDEYPFFQVVLYAAWSLGWWGPCVLTALIYTVLVGMLIRAARFFNLPASATFALSVVTMLAYLQVAYPLRPHVVTYLAVVALGIFLLRHRDEKNWTAFWPMALLQVAWVNSHSAFVLGPAMVGLFGAEMTVRGWIRSGSFPWAAGRMWGTAFVLILLACFVNPYGWDRFNLPFYQDRLESIRAYVGEMEPLGGGLATIYTDLSIAAAIGIVVNTFRRRELCYTFLLMAILFYVQAQSVQKAWPILGLFVPLLVLSSAVFSSQTPAQKYGAYFSALGNCLVAVLAGITLFLEFNPAWPKSLPMQWREFDRGRSEQSYDAMAWMNAHGVAGRLFHRCEDGGWLQAEGFDHGETFADTGFGKYDEAFIHEVGLVNERPALVPRYLGAYRPDYVVCSTFCYQWPYYLRKEGWRPIFYSPNSSVWARPGLRLDLPTVSNAEIATAFDHDLSTNGRPTDIRLFGRNLIALNSLGLEDFAFDKLTSLPKEFHHASWYWEAARFDCFSEPAFSADHRRQLESEAGQLHDDGLTAEFRAYCLYAAGDLDGALRILEGIPQNRLGNPSAELLAKIYLERNRPEALALTRRKEGWDLRDGRHWQYLAMAEERWGDRNAAANAWKKAVFYYPDDADLMKGAAAFNAKYPDRALGEAIADSSLYYGER